MNKSILGIDLGTSSVKLLLWHSDGQIQKAKASYNEKTPKGWLNAIKEAVKELDTSIIGAIGLSSQVGTYIINNTDVISWDSGVGNDELEYIKNSFSAEKFVDEIAMPHPNILSYPIPRLMYIKKHYKHIESICQPKDYILMKLTGNCVTDKYSFRGLVHSLKGTYSDFFLRKIGIDKNVLPLVVSPDTMAGLTTAQCAQYIGIPEGIPVFVGLNDFFSSVVGMGTENVGDMFDITGTSEHLGIICDSLNRDTKMVSGMYFDKYIHYGVTASSGASLDFGIKNFGFDDINIGKCLNNKPPIFTPYLNGERSPIFDSNARGTFLGISSDCSKQDMAYSILEGVSFSLYHIYENMGCPKYNNLTVSGGASKNKTLNILKSELFNTTVQTLKENDTSALGAARIAANALGIDTNHHFNPITDIISPLGKYRDILLQRYNIYKNIYASLKEQFIKFSNI